MNILGIYLLKQKRTGGDRRYLELMEALAERGNTVIVIMNTCFDYIPTHIKKIELNIQYTYRGFPPASYLFKKNLKKNGGFIREQIKKIFGKPADFLHIHGDTHLKGALFLKKYLSIPLFYAFRCNDIDRAHILRKNKSLPLKEHLFSLVYEPINRSREKQVARFAELITFQNQPDQKCFFERTKCNPSKTVIIPGNIGLPRCIPEWENKNASSSLKKIVYVGSLSASKGFWELLRALEILIKRGYPFLECHALGRLEDIQPTMNFIKILEIEKNIIIEGYKDPFPFFAENDLMVYPTLYDAFPDTVLEALHTGCPVIATAVGGLPDMLVYPELLFKRGDIGEIADKIEKCIREPTYYRHIRKLCDERAKAYHFDWAKNFEDAMADFLKKSPMKIVGVSKNALLV
jgi:glycosyltransferase involved in cell wall biosynthesis